LRLLEELLKQSGLEIHLVISPTAQKILAFEQGLEVDLDRFRPGSLGLSNAKRLVYHHYQDLAAPVASGSFVVSAMAVVPCSMGTAAAIANGLSDDLIQRCADVMLKERRPLLVVPRETPLSAIHLENLLKLSRLGVTVLPASPAFYGKPASVSALVDSVVGRVLDHLSVEHSLGPRWGKEV
jgi:flavin prenyltransferase